jgi:hypothetical protein
MGLVLLYVGLAVIACIVVGAIIVKVRRVQGSGFLAAAIVWGLVTILAMIKTRCTFDVYPCGFMSFTGGITWHLVPGLVGFAVGYLALTFALNHIVALGFMYCFEQLGRSIAPLLGLSLAVVWEVLPVGVIHPPSHGGPCPSVPVICHDVPVFGRGGLLYWTLPFVLWSVASLWVDLRRILRSMTIGQ